VDEQNSRVSEFRLSMQMMKWLRRNQAEFFYPKGQSLADELDPETLDACRNSTVVILRR
jgi:hypothetical protein